MWKVLIFACSPAFGSLIVDVFDSGSGGRDADVISAAAARGSLVCSMVVAMPRRSVRGARRRVASRSAIVLWCVLVAMVKESEVYVFRRESMMQQGPCLAFAAG